VNNVKQIYCIFLFAVKLHIAFLCHLTSSFTKPAYDKPPLERQCAIDNTNLLSPSTLQQSSSSQESSRRSSCQRSPNTFTPSRNVTIHSATECGSGKSSAANKSPIFTFPDMRRSSHCLPDLETRRPSHCLPDLASRRPCHDQPDLIKRAESSRIGSNVRSNRLAPNSQISGPSSTTKKKEKKKDWKEKEEEEGGGVDVIPIVGGVFIGGVLGVPVILIAGLKLGMFAAIGGGAMGYTTGKMFSDHG
jgi:hypothetical protein